MAAQFDLYQTPEGPVVTVLQSDLLDQLTTRVVAPLLPLNAGVVPLKTLNPVFELKEGHFVLMLQLTATLTRAELGQRVGSLSAFRDEILRATDMLWSGI